MKNKSAVKKTKRTMTQTQDDAYDKRNGIKEGSKADMAQDKKNGIKDNKAKKRAMPQRKPNKVMSGSEMLAKGIAKLGNGHG